MNQQFFYSIWTFIVIALFPIVILYIVELKKILAKLKKDHGNKWEALGSPGLIQNNSIGNSTKLIMFLLCREYDKLNDDELSKRAKICRYLLVIGILMSIFAFCFPIIAGNMA